MQLLHIIFTFWRSLSQSTGFGWTGNARQPDASCELMPRRSPTLAQLLHGLFPRRWWEALWRPVEMYLVSKEAECSNNCSINLTHTRLRPSTRAPAFVRAIMARASPLSAAKYRGERLLYSVYILCKNSNRVGGEGNLQLCNERRCRWFAVLSWKEEFPFRGLKAEIHWSLESQRLFSTYSPSTRTFAGALTLALAFMSSFIISKLPSFVAWCSGVSDFWSGWPMLQKLLSKNNIWKSLLFSTRSAR